MENINSQYGVVLEARASELTQGHQSGVRMEDTRGRYYW